MGDGFIVCRLPVADLAVAPRGVGGVRRCGFRVGPHRQRDALDTQALVEMGVQPGRHPLPPPAGAYREFDDGQRALTGLGRELRGGLLLHRLPPAGVRRQGVAEGVADGQVAAAGHDQASAGKPDPVVAAAAWQVSGGAGRVRVIQSLRVA